MSGSFGGFDLSGKGSLQLNRAVMIAGICVWWVRHFPAAAVKWRPIY